MTKNENDIPPSMPSNDSNVVARLKRKKASKQLQGPMGLYRMNMPYFPFGSMMMPVPQPSRLKKQMRAQKKARMARVSQMVIRTAPVASVSPAHVDESTSVVHVDEVQPPCFFYTKYGTCLRGESCFFLHDPRAITVCDAFVKGRCTSLNCRLRHETEMSRLPVCQHFLQGNCLVADCPYPHMSYGADASICRDFQLGLCSLEEDCQKVHTYVCADYYESSGTYCPDRSRCPYQHPIELVTAVANAPALQSTGPKPNQIPCRYLTMMGTCNRGNSCFYSHDQQAIAALKRGRLPHATPVPPPPRLSTAFTPVTIKEETTITIMDNSSDTSREGRDADISDMEGTDIEASMMVPKDKRLPIRTRKVR